MQQIVVTDKKFSLDEVMEKDDNLLHNSNMLNLSSARKRIGEEIKSMREEIARFEALDAEIVAFASVEDNLQNTTETARLHGEATGGKKQKAHTRW